MAAPVAAVIGLIISSASINYAKTHDQSVSGLRQAHVRPAGPRRPDPDHVLAAQAPVPGHHPGALRAGDLPAPLHLLRVRRPLPAGRRLVPGARLPPAAGAQAGRGGRSRPAPRPQGQPGLQRGTPAPRSNKRYTPPSLIHPSARDGLPAVPQHQEQRHEQQQDAGQDRRQHEDARRRVLGGDDGGR